MAPELPVTTMEIDKPAAENFAVSVWLPHPASANVDRARVRTAARRLMVSPSGVYRAAKPTTKQVGRPIVRMTSAFRGYDAPMAPEGGNLRRNVAPVQQSLTARRRTTRRNDAAPQTVDDRLRAEALIRT